MTTKHAVVITLADGCIWCYKAKAALKAFGYEVTEVSLTKGDTLHQFALAMGANSVPQVFINDKRIGGYEDTEKFLAAQAQA